MKTYKEKLNQYLNLPIDEEHQEGFKVGFKLGVKFAQKWISLNDEKPEHYELNGLEYMPNPVLVKKGDQIRIIKNFYKLVHFTHWRPIEYDIS